MTTNEVVLAQPTTVAEHRIMNRTFPRSCPFCGSHDLGLTTTHRKWWWVCCGGCGTDGPRARSGKKAIEAWNKDKVRLYVTLKDDDRKHTTTVRPGTSRSPSSS